MAIALVGFFTTITLVRFFMAVALVGFPSAIALISFFFTVAVDPSTNFSSSYPFTLVTFFTNPFPACVADFLFTGVTDGLVASIANCAGACIAFGPALCENGCCNTE